MKAAHVGVLAFLGFSVALMGTVGYWSLRSSRAPTLAESRKTRANERRTTLHPTRPRASRAQSAVASVTSAEQRAEVLARRLVELLGGAPADEDELSRIEAELLSLGDAAAAPLVAYLEGERDTARRERLLDVLRKVPGPEAESALIDEARSGPARSGRAMAIESLANRRTPAAFDALDQVARTDPELPDRPLITAALADDTSTELPDEAVFTPRMQAMEALASTEDPRATATLSGILNDERDESLRMQAARYLGRLKSDSSVIDALAAAAQSDPSPYVRLAALHSLEGLLNDALRPILARIAAHDSHAGVRLLASRILASQSGAPVE